MEHRITTKTTRGADGWTETLMRLNGERIAVNARPDSVLQPPNPALKSPSDANYGISSVARLLREINPCASFFPAHILHSARPPPGAGSPLGSRDPPDKRPSVPILPGQAEGQTVSVVNHSISSSSGKP